MMMAVMVFALVAVGCSKKPEDALLKHMEKMEKIMDSNMEKPKKGVEELRSYMQSNLPEMLEIVGKAMVELDKIDDKGKREERAKEMMKALEKGSESFATTAQKFGMKVMTDPDAGKYLEEWGESWSGLSGLMDMLGALR